MRCEHEWVDTPFAGGYHCKHCDAVHPGTKRKALLWSTGEWSSSPSDGRAYLEASETVNGLGEVVKVWRVYSTELDGLPLLTSRRFFRLADAQLWVFENVEPPDALGEAQR